MAIRFQSAVSDKEVTLDAVKQVLDDIEASGGRTITPDVAFLFFTGHHRDEAMLMLEELRLALDPQTVLGCSAEGVIGGEREIERAPGLALLVGELPDVRLQPFHVAGESEWRDVLGDADSVAERLGLGDETRAMIGLGDPFSTPIVQLLESLNRLFPSIPLIGGMASAAKAPGQNVLIRNEQVYDHGMVGLSLSGPVRVQTLVSQGCRPIGRPMVITRSHDNIIEQLGGKPALPVLREMVMALDGGEQQHLANGLFIGRAISEYQESWGRGDFLVRNVIGVDEATGAVGVADYVRTGQTVQFHARDGQTASEDLSELLTGQKASAQAAGGLLFSCNGRGSRMFDVSNHDVAASRSAMPQTPVAGFFAAGEFGPVGGQNFIHGHTASFALFHEPR